jgi:hypothetical protein
MRRWTRWGYQYETLAGKRGFVRSKLGTIRPTNSARFVVTPSNSDKGIVYVPKRYAENAVVTHITSDGRNSGPAPSPAW